MRKSTMLYYFPVFSVPSTHCNHTLNDRDNHFLQTPPVQHMLLFRYNCLTFCKRCGAGEWTRQRPVDLVSPHSDRKFCCLMAVNHLYAIYPDSSKQFTDLFPNQSFPAKPKFYRNEDWWLQIRTFDLVRYLST